MDNDEDFFVMSRESKRKRPLRTTSPASLSVYFSENKSDEIECCLIESQTGAKSGHSRPVNRLMQLGDSLSLGSSPASVETQSNESSLRDSRIALSPEEIYKSSDDTCYLNSIINTFSIESGLRGK